MPVEGLLHTPVEGLSQTPVDELPEKVVAGLLQPLDGLDPK